MLACAACGRQLAPSTRKERSDVPRVETVMGMITHKVEVLRMRCMSPILTTTAKHC